MVMVSLAVHPLASVSRSQVVPAPSPAAESTVELLLHRYVYG